MCTGKERHYRMLFGGENECGVSKLKQSKQSGRGQNSLDEEEKFAWDKILSRDKRDQPYRSPWALVEGRIVLVSDPCSSRRLGQLAVLLARKWGNHTCQEKILWRLGGCQHSAALSGRYQTSTESSRSYFVLCQCVETWFVDIRESIRRLDPNLLHSKYLTLCCVSVDPATDADLDPVFVCKDFYPKSRLPAFSSHLPVWELGPRIRGHLAASHYRDNIRWIRSAEDRIW